MIKRMIISITLLFAVLLLMLPKSDEASQKKITSASMLMCSREFRQEVAARLSRNESIDLTFTNSCPALIAELTLDEQGVMTLHGLDHTLTMVLTPRLEAGKVSWSCRGEPAERVTGLCKP